MKIKHIFFALLFIGSFTSCDDILNNLEDEQLTQDEIVQGLKTALEVGTDTSVAVTNVTDGFYGDKILKIFLPPEADIIVDNVSMIPGGNDAVEEVIKTLNRAAEDASQEAKPIFKDAITGMSITDGLSILNGTNPASTQKSYNEEEFDSTAATGYLRSTTYDKLVGAFSPKINTSLDKPLLAGLSANKAWTDLTSNWNKVAKLDFTGTLHEVNSDLGEHVTSKALDGLFFKVGEEEKKIRKNPFDWALDILQRVFGSVME